MSPIRKLKAQTAAVTQGLFQEGLLSQITETMFETIPVAVPNPRVTNIKKNKTAKSWGTGRLEIASG